MVNYGIISKIIGQLLFIEAFMMLVCLGTAFFYGEDDVLSFINVDNDGGRTDVQILRTKFRQPPVAS